MKDEVIDCLIVGTGLGAYGSILSALETKLRITVIDIGETLPMNLLLTKSHLKNHSVNLEDDHPFVKSHDFGVKSKQDLPRKTLYGSTFFYKELELDEGKVLPFTQAFGGYSVAWGGAFLPPQIQDLIEFPVDPKVLNDSIREILERLPHNSENDGLAPLFSDIGPTSHQQSLRLSLSQLLLLQKLSRLNHVDSKSKIFVGQSRLFTFNHGVRRCRYCGFCSSGCVYDSIFSTDMAIQDLAIKGKLKLLRGHEVLGVEEAAETVIVHTKHVENGTLEDFKTQICFIGAGAISSTSIALRSIQSHPSEVTFLKTGGFVQPFFSLRKLGFYWPHQNTQSSTFMDVLDSSIHPHWMHFQVSTPNEIVLKELGYFRKGRFSALRRSLIRVLCSHLAIVMVNLHSDPGLVYKVNIAANKDNPLSGGKLHITRDYKRRESRVRNFLYRKMVRVGLVPVPFSRKDISHGPGYHIGGSIPMATAGGGLNTDSQGRLNSLKRVHFIDTAVLSSIPGTTIGLLTMGNAFRITKEALTALTSESSD
jgi:hypothetical protein